MIQAIQNLFRHRNKAKLLNGHQVIEAFKFGGIQYYELKDIFDIPCQRAFTLRDYMEELRMRCTREFLQAHVTAINNILSAPKTINIPELARLNQQLQERLDMIVDAEIVYKLASVYYFDASEQPYTYNFKHGLEKIKAWKGANEDMSFFYLEPVKQLCNLTILLEDDLQAYLTVQAKMTAKQLENIFTHLSESDKKKDFAQTLISLGQ